MKKTIKYLKNLIKNNNREWYHAHKKEYKEANEEFLDLLDELKFAIGKSDDSILDNVSKELTFKLTRDTRFSKDKSPYNPAFRAHMSSKGKLPIPVGYFICIKPNNQSFIGGGLFADMFKDATTMIRDYIVDHGEEWEDIITDSEFTKYFEVKGAKLKNVPKTYDPQHPQAEYLKYKSWYLEFFVSDEELLSKDFIKKSVKVFEAMQPFNDFLNKALDGFEMPKRP
jgi:uncharacterized protein (TIGR02453 family)